MRETLEMFAQDIGVSYSQVRTYRHTTAKWLPEQRAEGISFEIHHILEKLGVRFERIASPPRHPRSGKLQWTGDDAAPTHPLARPSQRRPSPPQSCVGNRTFYARGQGFSGDTELSTPTQVTPPCKGVKSTSWFWVDCVLCPSLE